MSNAETRYRTERDLARAERDRARAKRDQLAADLQRVTQEAAQNEQRADACQREAEAARNTFERLVARAVAAEAASDFFRSRLAAVAKHRSSVAEEIPSDAIEVGYPALVFLFVSGVVRFDLSWCSH